MQDDARVMDIVSPVNNCTKESSVESSAMETAEMANGSGGKRTPFVVSFDHSSPAVQVGLEFATRPRPRSAVITLTGRRSTYDVTPTSGAAWSQHLNRHFCYVEADGPSWISGDITFEEPVDEISFEVIAWPSQTAWPSEGLLKWAVVAKSDDGLGTATIHRVGDK